MEASTRHSGASGLAGAKKQCGAARRQGPEGQAGQAQGPQGGCLQLMGSRCGCRRHPTPTAVNRLRLSLPSLVHLQRTAGKNLAEKTIFIFQWRYPGQMGAELSWELGFLHQETTSQGVERVTLGPGDLTCSGKGQKS